MTVLITQPPSKIKQYDTDPSNPKVQSAWVLRTSGGGPTTEGMPMGLLMALTYATTGGGGGGTTYQFSYRTRQGTTIRNTLS